MRKMRKITKRTPLNLIGFCLLIVYSWWLPAFAQAPTKAKIAFTSTRDGNGEIYLMDVDGKNQVNLTQHPAEDFSSAWSPTGKQLAFVSNRDRERDIYLMDTDGRNVRKLSGGGFGINYSPAWAPDGKKIAFEHVEGAGVLAIYVANVDGSPPIRVTQNPVTLASAPAWSPDGKQLAFESWTGPRAEIYIVNLETQQLRKLTPGPLDRAPAWSPDGEKIAFTRHEGDGINLYVINSDGNNLVKLIAGFEVGEPAWSPDGKYLLYQERLGGIGGNLQLFLISADGGKPKQLTHIGANSQPDWFDPAVLAVDLKDKLLTTWGRLKKGAH